MGHRAVNETALDPNSILGDMLVESQWMMAWGNAICNKDRDAFMKFLGDYETIFFVQFSVSFCLFLLVLR